MLLARLAHVCAATAVVAGMVLAIPVTARAGTGEIAVDIHGYQFQPNAVSVEVGEPVTWTNHDSAAHDVTSSSGPEAFASPSLATGQSYTLAFTQPGSYTYLCSVHPDMVGALTVTPAPAVAAVVAPPPTLAAPAAAVARATPPSRAAVPSSAAAPVASPTVARSAAVPAVPPVLAAVRPDLAHALRPYADLLAMATAVVAACLLLLGVGRRADAVDG